MLGANNEGFIREPSYYSIVMAYQAHIVIPTTHDRAGEVINTIETSMAVKFGGYSQYDGLGGWDDGEQVVTEEHTRLVANTNEFERDNVKEFLRIEAEYAKDILGEDAVLIEVHGMEMELV
jgi:hypothetical protein